MNCFKHREQQAIGICKHCYRAVCPTCMLQAAGAVVCSPECAAEVSKMDALVRNVPRARTGNVVIYVGMGMTMLLVGALMHDLAGGLIAGIGVLMLFGAYFMRPKSGGRTA